MDVPFLVGLDLVTGAGRGFGKVVARHLADAGLRVAVLGRNRTATETIATEIGGIPLFADILDRSAVDAEVARLVRESGAPDVLVNNAGVGGSFGLAWEQDPDDWWNTVEVNVRGTHHVTRAVVPSMVDAGRGRIINVVSHAGTARWPYGSPYVVAKAGLIKYGENLAAEVRKAGISVFNYHPGILEIGLTETLFASSPEPGSLDEMISKWFAEQIAEGRSVDPDESASKLVRFALGEADQLSGRYFTAYDDLDEIFARASDIKGTDVYTLGLIQSDDEVP